MKRKNLIYIALIFAFLMLLASCSAESVTVEAGITDASAITGVEGSEFAEGFDVASLKTVGKHSVSVIVDGKTKKYTVEVVDTTAPVIEAGAVRIYVGDGVAWKKLVSVTDNSDGKIDIKVDSSGVDINKPGVYKAIYTATDESGNSSTATAYVDVSLREITEDMLNAELDKVIAQIITPDMNTEAKIRAVYDYVQDSISYSVYAGSYDYVYAAYTSLFMYGTGDCYSYFSASKAFFERLGIENIDMTRAEGGAPGNHYWNLVNIGTKDAPKWYHYDANPISGQYSVSGCLLTDAQVAAYDAWCGQGYRKYDASKVPASASEIITDIPELRG